MIRALSEVFSLLLLLFVVFVVPATFASTFISHNFQLTTADGTRQMGNGKWEREKANAVSRAAQGARKRFLCAWIPCTSALNPLQHV